MIKFVGHLDISSLMDADGKNARADCSFEDFSGFLEFLVVYVLEPEI
jgi:hypothetical protein